MSLVFVFVSRSVSGYRVARIVPPLRPGSSVLSPLVQ